VLGGLLPFHCSIMSHNDQYSRSWRIPMHRKADGDCTKSAAGGARGARLHPKIVRGDEHGTRRAHADIGGRGPPPHPDGSVAPWTRDEPRLDEFALGPGDVHDNAGARDEAPYGPGGKTRRHGGKQLDLAAVALQERLGDAGDEAVVGVDLERRVRREQVRVEAPGELPVVPTGIAEEQLNELVEAVATAKARPHRHLPRE